MSKKPLIILYGGGGHGKVVADALEKEGTYQIAGWLDDAASGEIYGIPVLGGKDAMMAMKEKGITHAFVSIGSPAARQSIQDALKKAGLTIATIRHPSAQVARGAVIGEGTVLMPNAVVGPDVKIGDGCIINTGATVDHDCRLGDFAHVAPGAHLAGGVTVGAMTHIGIGSCVKEGVTIGKNVMLGAGSVVIDDLPDGCTAFGVPAKVQTGR